VEITRATVIDAAVFADEDAARSWLRHAAGRDNADETIGAALRVLNRAVTAHRLGAADPRAVDLDASRAIVTRIGYGAGEQVATGEWTDAVDVASAPPGRESVLLRPQERLSALLGGRDAPLACEELALRARLDVDAGRHREAALQLRVAIDAALAELEPFRELSGVAVRLDAVREQADDVRTVADAALLGGLRDDECALVRQALERVESVLRARVAASEY
jgi:hypothetical protein